MDGFNSVPDKGTFVLEKTENSDLLPIGKASELEFFERVFAKDGPFWKTYVQLGLGAKPEEAYMYPISGRMYFAPSVTDKYIYTVGMQKELVFENGKLIRKRKLNLDNIILLLSAPIDTFKHASSTILAAFKANEYLKKFIDFSKDSKVGWNTGINPPIKAAEDSLELALKCMEFSFISSIAYSLNIKLSDSPAWMECELESLLELLKSNNVGEAKKQFAFYASNPYAISEPHFIEDGSGLKAMTSTPIPKNKYLRWRENCKFLAARYLMKRRLAYLRVGEETGLGNLVFFLKTDELETADRKLAEERKAEFEKNLKKEFPPQYIFVDGSLVEQESDQQIHGQTVAAMTKLSGKAIFVNSKKDFEKDLDGKILVSKSLTPDLVELYDKVIGIVSETGGALAHAAVIAREMNFPCIVQTKNFDKIKEGDTIELDGTSGIITIQNI